MIRTTNRYNNFLNFYQQGTQRRKTTVSHKTAGNTAMHHTVVLDVQPLPQSKLKDMGREVVLTETENADLQNNLFRNAKTNILNLNSLVDNHNAESCFHGTIGNAEDVDYYQIDTFAQSFAMRPVYITMDAPQGSGCRMSVYDKGGNQVGVSEPNEDGTQTLRVPSDWSFPNRTFILKIEGGNAGQDQEIPYRLSFRQGDSDPEFKAWLDSWKNEPAKV